MKTARRALGVLLAVYFAILPCYAQVRPGDTVYAGGMSIGIDIGSRGPVVTGFSPDSPALKSGVKAGDILTEVNGEPITESHELLEKIKSAPSDVIRLKLLRGGEELEISVARDGEARLGVSVRDSVSGLGTVTYIEKDGSFGSLGHGVCDPDTAELVELSRGKVCKANVDEIIKGTRGHPGQLEGEFSGSELQGVIYANIISGIYGEFDSFDETSSQLYTVSSKSEIKPGKATIRCSLEKDSIGEYEIRIVKVFDDEGCRDFVIKVTDPELLEKTGGIVQGMSGSPIIQDGKLIGAVTHVLVNDPTRGYGISIEKMSDLLSSQN